MRKSDPVFVGFLLLLFLPFFLSERLYAFYSDFNTSHGFLMAFMKFALLATSGEMLGSRIRSGQYLPPHFGLVARALVWGLLGIAIKAAFIIFANGTPLILESLGIQHAGQIMEESFSPAKLLIAFSISLCMNTMFAPVMMSLHKITDTHIAHTEGNLFRFLTKPMRTANILQEINWKVHWGFVLRKTIPFFWIPAHTITFLLPAGFRVLFAALLGIVLGVILAFAARKAPVVE